MNPENKPLAVDLFCGLGGWTEGLMAEGYYVVGFDITQHVYGEHRYPAQLVIQDVLTLHGSQFKNAALIVASPPCQEYSYMAMPWKVAKAKAADIRADASGTKLADLNRLFDACFRIQREASAAAGHHIPMVVENVRGAQPWVGRSRWSYGSFHLWGDVPALMPMTKSAYKSKGLNWSDRTKTGQDFTRCAGEHAIKNAGGSWFSQGNGARVCRADPRDHLKTVGHLNQRDGHRSTAHLTNPAENIKWGGDSAFASNNRDHIKGLGKDLGEQGFNVQAAEKFGHPGGQYTRTAEDKRQHLGSRRRFASAMIAKIPEPLSRHIARTYYPQ